LRKGDSGLLYPQIAGGNANFPPERSIARRTAESPAELLLDFSPKNSVSVELENLPGEF
jgi:hypothetical protein